MNTLYYGDNLEILRNHEYFPTHSVDLIYLDPPFNSNRDPCCGCGTTTRRNADTPVRKRS